MGPVATLEQGDAQILAPTVARTSPAACRRRCGAAGTGHVLGQLPVEPPCPGHLLARSCDEDAVGELPVKRRAAPAGAIPSYLDERRRAWAEQRLFECIRKARKL
jgi:hypothetical protein